jgi:hypothetical protein
VADFTSLLLLLELAASAGLTSSCGVPSSVSSRFRLVVEAIDVGDSGRDKELDVVPLVVTAGDAIIASF